VVLNEPIKVLQAQLVLDRNDEFSVLGEEPCSTPQIMLCRVTVVRKNSSIFQDANQQDPLVTHFRLKGQQVIDHNPNVRQVAASLCRDACALKTALDCRDLCSQFSQKPGDGAATGAEFQHLVALPDTQGTNQAMALTTEVVLGRPIDD